MSARFDSCSVGETLPDGSQIQITQLGGIPLDTTPIPAGAGTVAIPTVAGSILGLPFAVPESTLVRIEVDAMFSAAGDKVWNGTLVGSAKRVGNGALIVDSQGFSAGLDLTDTLWDPEIVATGNSLELQITADSFYVVNPRGAVRIVAVDTSGDDPIDALSLARMNVLADNPTFLVYSDVDLTPLAPLPGDPITNWADQSGGAHDLTFAVGNRPIYAIDGTVPAVDFRTAEQAVGVTNLALATGSAKVWRWTMRKTNPATPSVEILWYAGANFYILIHCAGGSIAAGTRIAVQSSVSGFSDLGVCPAGKHDFELVLSGGFATLYVDGVAGAPVACSEPAAYTANLALGGWNGLTWSSDSRIFGACFFAGAATALARANWITMSQLAWGPHD